MSLDIVIKGAAICCPQQEALQGFGLECLAVDKNLLPKSLRRRTSLATRMAITAATHACNIAELATSKLPAVFATVGGEIQVTDALCRTLPDHQALLSPTQFHNSVNNTTAGYWGILQHCQSAATAIAAVEDTFAMGLLEAGSQLQQIGGNILLVCYDEEWPQYLAPPMGSTACACALVLSSQASNDQFTIKLPQQNIGEEQIQGKLLEFIKRSPAAAAVPLFQVIQNSYCDSYVPLSIGASPWYTHISKITL